MEVEAERWPIFSDPLVLKPIYAHQRALLHEGDFKKLKITVPTAGGKTLGALLFALRQTFADRYKKVRALFTYPTNLLSRDQFQHSILGALRDWIGATVLANGSIDPVQQKFVSSAESFEYAVAIGAPTYVLRLPDRLAPRDLYVTIITGEGLQHLFSEENKATLGRRKGTYLLRILEVLNQHDHIILSSPDLLGYVAQRCYSSSSGFYNNRWRDELELKLAEHQVVVDEYHFYDPYTYINLERTLERLGVTQWLCLSATSKRDYFSDAQELNSQSTDTSSSLANGWRIASFPISVTLHRGEMSVTDPDPQDNTIYFYNSVIAAHETALALDPGGTKITEFTGIRKSVVDQSRLTIATSAAEVGLDLPFRQVNTEFWGNSWEVPSLIQRVGRVGRSEKAAKSMAHVWITGREPDVLFKAFENTPQLSKKQFATVLLEAFGEETFNEREYVSFYLWDEARIQELRRFWQTPPEVKKLRFHFRPPNSQAVFNWAGTRFAYDFIPIHNRYFIEKISDLTDAPFWQEMGYSEWRVVGRRGSPMYLQRYEGKKDKNARRHFW
ncbi:MAG: hypothetical protein WBQ86_21715 [Candidatus Binatus sp.]